MTNKKLVLMAMMTLTMYIGTVQSTLQSESDLEYCDEVLPEVPEEVVEVPEDDGTVEEEPVEEEPVEEEVVNDGTVVDVPVEEEVVEEEEEVVEEEPVEEEVVDNGTVVDVPVEEVEEVIDDPVESLQDGEVVVQVDENETRNIDVVVDCGYCEPKPEPRFILVPEVTCRNITTSSLIESTSMTTFTSYSTIIQTFTSESPVVFSVPTMFCEQVCETTMVESTETPTETTSETTETDAMLPTDQDIVIDDGDRSVQGISVTSGVGKAYNVCLAILCGLFVFVV